MKRDLCDIEDTMDMANCLMLLSKVGEYQNDTEKPRVFSCRICNRQFSSFQALGGHRASRKRARLLSRDSCQSNDQVKSSKSAEVTLSVKEHVCSICGLKFAIGQSLGGHMRRHRVVVKKLMDDDWPRQLQVPVLKRSNSSKRVLCLDLNLMPWENDYLKIRL